MNFSFARMFAVLLKEFRQMRRDRLTFAMIVAIPIVQLILFGFAINNNPKHLPTAIISADNSTYSRSIISGLQNTEYFQIIDPHTTEQQAKQLLALGKVSFVIHIPSDFTRELIAGKRPAILVSADATDPVTIVNATAALQQLAMNVLTRDLQNTTPQLADNLPAFQFIIHPNYNPEAITQYNIVPGLMGVILTMTMVMITALAITREHERGTMEYLLATPVNALEIMLGKIIPYILMGYLQLSVIVTAAFALFNIPFQGNLILLLVLTLPFIAANLAVGLTFSTIAKNQLQAMQMTFFFFLPSILLSGFMFPVRGMPIWAQWLSELFPLTHYLQIVRGIMLKGNGLLQSLPSVWPILLFMLVVIVLGLKRFRNTLD